MRDIKDNKEGFNKCISSKRKTREYVGLLLNVPGDLETKDVEKAEVLSAFFTSVFTGNTSLQQSQALNGKTWRKEYLSSVTISSGNI